MFQSVKMVKQRNRRSDDTAFEELNGNNSATLGTESTDQLEFNLPALPDIPSLPDALTFNIPVLSEDDPTPYQRLPWSCESGDASEMCIDYFSCASSIPSDDAALCLSLIHI